MIQSLRDSATSFWFKAILILICASFLFFGISIGGSDIREGQVAQIANDEITQRDFQIEYRNFLFQRNLEDITPELEQTVKSMVLGQMIEQRLMTQEAKKLGFHSSEDNIRKTIQEGFFGDQPFDFEIYKNYVRTRMGKTTAKFEEMQGDRIKAALMSQWFDLTSTVPDQEVAHTYQLENQKRNLTVIALPQEKIAASISVKQPSAEDLQAYFDANATSYVTPEKRKVTVLVSIKKDTQEDNNQFFERMQSQWAFVQKDPQLALATLANEDADIHLTQTDWVTFGDTIDLVDAQDTALILNATRELDRGARTAALHARSGEKVYLVELNDIEASRPATLDEVRNDVIAAWKAQEQTKQSKAYAENLLAQWKSKSSSPSALAKSKGLTSTDTGLMTYTANVTIAEVGTSPLLLKQAFAMNEKGWIDEVFTINGTLHLAYVQEVEQADWTSFQTEKADLVYQTEQEMNNLKQYLWMDAARKKANIQQIDISML